MSHGRPADLDSTVARPRAESGPRFGLWGEPAFLLLLPLLAFWGFNLRPIHQAEALDPYVYTGYINNPTDLLQRFGLTYYAVRFGLILPGRLFTSLLGSVAGYFALRYVLALVAGIPLYAFAKRRLSLPVAVLAYLGLVTCTLFDLALLWDYPDATGVPFLCAAICLILLDRAPSWPRDGAAGFCASMALNSNVFTAALFAIFVVVYAALSLLYGTPWLTLLKRSAMTGAGFVLVLAGGYVYYWNTFGMPVNIFRPTIDVAILMSSGGAKTWHTPGFQWVFQLFHVFVPVLIALCCLAAGIRRRTRFETAVAAVSGAAVVGFFYVHQFLLSGNSLELYYYFSYAIPFCILMLACTWQALWERFSWNAAVFVAVSGAAMLAPSLLVAADVHFFEMMGLGVWVTIATIAAVAVSLASVQWPVSGWRTAVLVLAAVTLLGASVTGGLGGYYRVVRPYLVRDDSEIALYRVSLQFIKVVPKLHDHPGGLRFWYNNRPGNPITSVQATYLWEYSKINAAVPGDPGLPYIGAFQVKLLQDPDLRYLGLLGESPAEIQRGLDALTSAQVGYQALDHCELASGNYRIYWQLVAVTSHTPKPAELPGN